MLWNYQATSHDINPFKLGRRYCIFCRTHLDDIPLPNKDEWLRVVKFCGTCGWWWLDEGTKWVASHYSFRGTYALLQELDLLDMQQPILEVRQYLLSNYRARLSMSWELLEDTVAEVFRDFGYQVHVTARQRDGGIDVVCGGPNGEHVGIQVKRYRGKIEADQIRELVGALVVGRMTSGIFVTTSTFTRGAKRTARDAACVGIPVELIDAPSFLDALRVTTRAIRPSVDEWVNLVDGASTSGYDSLGFVSSPNDRNDYITGYYKRLKKTVPNLRAIHRGATPRVVRGPGGYQLQYVFDETVRLFVGIATGPSGPPALLDFELEQDAQKSLERWMEAVHMSEY